MLLFRRATRDCVACTDQNAHSRRANSRPAAVVGVGYAAMREGRCSRDARACPPKGRPSPSYGFLAALAACLLVCSVSAAAHIYEVCAVHVEGAECAWAHLHRCAPQALRACPEWETHGVLPGRTSKHVLLRIERVRFPRTPSYSTLRVSSVGRADGRLSRSGRYGGIASLARGQNRLCRPLPRPHSTPTAWLASSLASLAVPVGNVPAHGVVVAVARSRSSASCRSRRSCSRSASADPAMCTRRAFRPGAFSACR